MLQIVIHTLPHEIDQLERVLIDLKHNANQLNESDEILVDVVLNTNLVYWQTSHIRKAFFIEKFNQLEELTKTWAKTKFEVNTDDSIQGCVSHRRKAFKETEADALLILDTDIFFSDNLLYYIINAVNVLKKDQPYFILTPQITPMWDESWNVIVNDWYKNDKIHFQSRDPYQHNKSLGNVTVNPINGFKFSGGWATVISVPLAKKIAIPESLGHYGLEDTYIMYCSEMMKQKGIDVNQYVLENEIVIEDNLFRYSPYKTYLSLIDKQEEFKKIANLHFKNELIKFGQSI